MLDEMTTYKPKTYRTVMPQRYAGDGKYEEIQYRFTDVKATTNKKLLMKVNSYMRRGWVVTHWNMGWFFPSARLMKTLAVEETTND